MIIFNNLVVNVNSKKFQPFLFNLISGRRRLLSSEEFRTIRKVCSNEKLKTKEERVIINNLFNEKQFISDFDRNKIEQKLYEVGAFCNNKVAKDYRFSIELTRSCNMSCPYCYVKNRLSKNNIMNKKHIDSIYKFYTKYADELRKVSEIPYIRITGGEPLVNEESTNLIGYISKKWPNSKLILFTNGVNLIKYFDLLPLKNLFEVHISLDGIKSVHMKRRYSSTNTDEKIYDNIILGIKKLIANKVNVKIKTTVDKYNYLFIEEFKEFLIDNEILDSQYCELILGVTLDYGNELDILESHNSKDDISDMKNYLEEKKIALPTYPSFSNLLKIISRPKNEPYIPKCRRCDTSILSKYYFSCNGKIYFCDCINESDGIIGEFYPNQNIEFKEIKNLQDRNVLKIKKCSNCKYKFICGGGCLLSSRTKHQEASCGIFNDDELLDNLEFNYEWIK